jgi:hypothetical protein
MHVIQYISIGDKETAENNIRKYSDFYVYPYRNGIIPIILTGYASYIDDESIRRRAEGYAELSKKNVTYIEGLNPYGVNRTALNRLNSRAELIGFEGVYSRGEFYNYTEQRIKLMQLKQNAKKYGITLDGFIPRELKYNLDTLEVLEADNYSYIIAQPTSAYFGPFYLEGQRNPVFAQLYGSRTDIVILPVSNPTGTKLNTTDIDELVGAWKSLIDVSAVKDDMCVLFWSPDWPSGIYLTKLIEVIDYGRESGLTFTTPEEVAEHYRLVQNIDSLVSFGEYTVNITAHNRNNETLSGLTYVTTLPYIYGECLYTSTKARVVRTSRQPYNCRVYVSVDLQPNERKEFTVGLAFNVDENQPGS